MPAQPKGATPKDPPSSCTCGHHFGREDQGDDAGSNDQHLRTSVNSIIMAQSSTAATIGATNTTSGSNHHPTTYIGNRPLDASFVQVPQHDYRNDPTLLQLHQDEQQKHGAATSTHDLGKAEYYLRLTRLEQAANAGSSEEPPPPLCLSCIQRVDEALDSETERMDAECQAYREAIREDKARIKAWQLAVQVSFVQSYKSSSTSHPNNNYDDDGQEVVSSPASDRRDSIRTTAPHDNNQQQQYNMEEAFRNEIALLEEACQQHREELLQLRAVQHEQQQMTLELDRVHEAMSHEQNALELEARAFDNDQEQLSRALLEILDEVERLSSPQLQLPATLLRLQVDRERGLRYPLINELRLAYRPKGDVQWHEIQAAWALASQLLLSICTLFHFQRKPQQPCSGNNNNCWRLIPLSHCAKLFYYPSERSNTNDRSGPATGSAVDNKTHTTATAHTRPIVFNLGHPKTNQSKALLTWNALLCQVIQHVTAELTAAVDLGILDVEEVPPLPFEISPTKIGHTWLTQLGEDDDGGWSRVIHCMTSNLLWLSDSASLFVRHQVVLESSTALCYC